MDVVVVVARLVLAAVFVAAAVAKLLDLDSFERATADLGVSQKWARVARVGVPTAELVLAVGLLVTWVASLAALGATILLLAFTALLASNLRKGRRPACNCFGSAGAEPISWTSVIRNAVLIAVGVVSAIPAAGVTQVVVDAFEEQTGLIAALSIGIAVVTASATVVLARTAVQSNDAAPAVADSRNDQMLGTSVAQLGLRNRLSLTPGVPALVVRTDPNCGPCSALLPRIVQWQENYAGIVEFVILTSDVEDDAHGYSQLQHVVTGEDSIATELRLNVTPSAVLVSADDEIASAVAEGAIEIGDRVSLAVRGAPDTPLGLGDPATSVVLDSSRGIVTLADFLGSLTLLVFWDPYCSFCQDMLVELRQWEQAIAGSNRRLLVASQSTNDAVAPQGFRSYALDHGGAVMHMFGGYGTPSAVLIDAAGRVAAEIAHGAPEVRALMDRADLLGGLGAAATSAR